MTVPVPGVISAHRLQDGIDRLEAAWARAEPGDWRRPVRFRNGDLAGTVFTRWHCD